MRPRRAWMPVSLILLLQISCAQDPLSDSPGTGEPLGLQMMRADPTLQGQRFRTLLSFESDSDLVFVQSRKPAADATLAHTGRKSAKIESGSATIKLSPLIKPAPFPGEWTLVGGYVYATAETELTIVCRIGPATLVQRKLPLSPGQWTAAMLDISQLSDVKGFVTKDADVTLTLQANPSAPLQVDDVLLIDNETVLFGDPQEEASLAGPWIIRRRGLYYTGSAPGRFNFKLLAAEASPIGWRPLELNALRARFESPGPQKSVTIYQDGRAYWDGEYRPLSATAADAPYVAAHRSPGVIKLPEEQGRVERNTPGDANNDGYNESRGAYPIHAHGPRLELTVVPQDAPLMRPVLEISNLPQGKVSVSVQGRLLDEVLRTEDGTVLVDISARVFRPTAVNVKVE